VQVGADDETVGRDSSLSIERLGIRTPLVVPMWIS